MGSTEQARRGPAGRGGQGRGLVQNHGFHRASSAGTGAFWVRLHQSDACAGLDLCQQPFADLVEECVELRLVADFPVSQRQIDLHDQRFLALAQELVQSLVGLFFRAGESDLKRVLERRKGRCDCLGRGGRGDLSQRPENLVSFIAG